MIGDIIGKPGRGRRRAACCPGCARSAASTSSPPTARTSPAAWASRCRPPRRCSTPASTSSRRGNHIWDKREIYPYLEANERVLRPLNYGTHGVPGRGWGIYHALDGTELAVINLQGRTYMQPIDNPFTDADRLLDEASEPLPPIRLVDFHCELTSEKNALGLYLDGRVSVVVGTHTHVVTGDERILPQGHGLPDRPRDDRPAVERHRLRPARPSCRGSSTRCRPGSRSARGRSSSTPARSTSTRRPAARSRSSGSSASSTPDGR